MSKEGTVRVLLRKVKIRLPLQTDVRGVPIIGSDKEAFQLIQVLQQHNGRKWYDVQIVHEELAEDDKEKKETDKGTT